MILELILNPIFILLEWMSSLFPLLSLPVDILSGLFSILELWTTLDKFVPVNFVLILIGSYWTLVNGKLLIAILTWIYEKIPFI